MLIDLKGTRFGKLIVIDRAGVNKFGQPMWLCRCDCGIDKIARGQSLRKGWTKSCGCFRREMGHERTSGVMNNRKHGMWKTPEYRAWRSCIERCNPNSKDAPMYEDRGIDVCERWLTSFENFYADMGSRPSPKHSIERKKNGEGYSPENCIWATAKEQQRNTRRNRMIKIGERTQCIAAWAEEAGLSWSVFDARLRRGWTGYRLLSPVT